MKSLKVRLKLNYLQTLKLETLSNEHRLLYNFLLEQSKNNCDFKSLHYLSKQFRKENNLTINAKSTQNTSRLLINNIKSFFALRKKNPTKNPKFPYKFKSWKYFTTFSYDVNGNFCGGFKIKDNALILQKGLLEIELSEICKSINNIKQIVFKREETDYYLTFIYAEPKLNFKFNKENFMSIDLGLSKILTAFDSTGFNFSIQNKQFKKLEKQLKYLHSRLDLSQRNSSQ